MRSTGEINVKPTTSIAAILLEFRQARRGGGKRLRRATKGAVRGARRKTNPTNKISDTHTSTFSTYPTRAKHISESQLQKMETNRQKGEKCRDTSSRRMGLPNTCWTTPKKAIQKKKFAN